MTSPQLTAAPSIIAASAPLSEVETVDCYNSLAAEYDSVEHRTTRELERLSGLSLIECSLFQSVGREPFVVELGCGTGALSREIAREQRGGCLLLTDPAPRMLSRAGSAVATSNSDLAAISLCGSAEDALARLTSPPDAIIAGLADPYLSNALLKSLLGTCAPHTLIFFSVPSQRWARIEREQRLGVPLDRTRFRTCDGRILFSRSVALDPDDLAGLFTDSGIEVLDHGARQSGESEHQSAPEVSWVMGRPL